MKNFRVRKNLTCARGEHIEFYHPVLYMVVLLAWVAPLCGDSFQSAYYMRITIHGIRREHDAADGNTVIIKKRLSFLFAIFIELAHSVRKYHQKWHTIGFGTCFFDVPKKLEFLAHICWVITVDYKVRLGQIKSEFD